MDKQKTLETLRNFSKKFPKDALLEIRANREDYVTDLLDSLNYTRDNAQELYEQKSEYFLYIYAMHMLSEFKEKKAFTYIIDLLEQPEDIVEYIFGDGLTENVYHILFNTFSKEYFHKIYELIENEKAYEWSRLAALNCYKLLCFGNIITREETINYFRSLIYDKLSKSDCVLIFTGIVNSVLDLNLKEMTKDVMFLYDEDRVDISAVGDFDDFIEEIDSGIKNNNIGKIDNAIEYMSSWYCFKSK